MLTLHSARASATIDLDGGRLASLIIDGHEIMVTEGDRPTRWGSFPMIPWCGRLDHGRFTFGDVEYQMPITSAPHANHGRAHLQMWELDGTATIRTALAVPWPFGGFATQEFVLTDIVDWFDAGALDGFIAIPGGSIRSLDLFLDQLVPALVDRGLFRSDYQGCTLRDHLHVVEAT